LGFRQQNKDFRRNKQALERFPLKNSPLNLNDEIFQLPPGNRMSFWALELCLQNLTLQNNARALMKRELPKSPGLLETFGVTKFCTPSYVQKAPGLFTPGYHTKYRWQMLMQKGKTKLYQGTSLFQVPHPNQSIPDSRSGAQQRRLLSCLPAFPLNYTSMKAKVNNSLVCK
jgi:hypothetical protein